MWSSLNDITNFLSNEAFVTVTNLSRKKRHPSYIKKTEEITCIDIHNFNNYEEKCDFATHNEDCLEYPNYFNYINMLYCLLPDIIFLRVIGVVGMIALLVYLFATLGITADKYFCPSLAIIADFLRMSETLAGVTILAFGNCSPDLFTAISEFDGDTQMVYVQLFGSSLFVLFLVGSLIMLISPFTMSAYSIIRNLIFLTLGCIWVAYAFSDLIFTRFDAVSSLILYILFLGFVIGEHFLASSAATAEPGLSIMQPAILFEDETMHVSPNKGLVSQFFKAIYPINIESWKESGIIGRIFSIIMIPSQLLLSLIIPLCDFEEDRNGWSKLLNILHCFTLPFFFIYLLNVEHKHFLGISFYIWILPFCLAIANMVFCTSRTDRPPTYHILYAMFGTFIGSILVISAVANEVVAVLGSLGIVLELSKPLLALSALTVGNSLGDLIGSITLAKNGYAKMAFAACFGGPMFNNLVSLGIVMNMKISYGKGNEIAGETDVREGLMGSNCALFLFLGLVFMLLAFITTKFQARRSLAFFFISFYGYFIIFCFLCEFEIAHSYGTDHRGGN